MLILHKFNDIGMVNNLSNAQRAFRVEKWPQQEQFGRDFLTTWRGIYDMNGRDVEMLLPSKALR